MITQQEIMEFSREWQLPSETIEKDYVLGWLLAGIANHPQSSNQWVFKGGTCLKKCFFETYRFSEDLDFSLQDEAVYEVEALRAVVREVCEWVTREAGIELPLDRIRLDESQNLAGQLTFYGRIYYRAALRRNREEFPRVKLDLTKYERIVTEPVRREVFHAYSDSLPVEQGVLAYSIEELTAEKIRALYERARPRDLYDVVHLLRNRAEEVPVERVRNILQEKCKYKGIPFPSVQAITTSEYAEDLRAAWEGMLRAQLPVLPQFEAFWGELPILLAWLDRRPVDRPALPTVALQAGEEFARYPSMRAWHVAAPVEVLRFAGANRLCVWLTYSDKRRTVEPYSFAASKKGDLSFYGWEWEGDQIKRYRLDRIELIEVSDTTFTPRYRVEF